MSPQKARIRMYKVGFGDCFLLSFFYARAATKHLLIDFGTTQAPAGSANLLTAIAEDVRKETQGQLDNAVATHRHKDHISGFATTTKGNGPGDIIRALKPKLVLLPWTEDPDAKEDATGPTKTRGAQSLRKQLQQMHAVAERAVRLGQQAPAGVPEAVRARLAFVGEDNIKNVAAVKNLLTMGQECRYLFYGADAGLAALLPGVTVTVLGPPTLAQSDQIRRERASDSAQFWMIAAAASAHPGKAAPKPLFADRFVAAEQVVDEEVRWLTERLARTQAEQLLGIVTVLDSAMNNTSLILLFEVNGKKLLFPGDAQIENWEYALSQPEVVASLAAVDLYKVGHHGSRNATPRSLWNNFGKRSTDAHRPGRLKTLLSTEAGKHGQASQHTEVPRKTLVAELTSKSELHNTQSIQPGQGLAFDDIEVQF